MNKFSTVILGYLVTFIIGYLTMTNGWGMQVVSWGWIIGGFISSSVSTLFMMIALEN